MKGLSTFVSKYESKYEDFKVKHAQRKSSEKVNKTKQSKAGNSVFRKETSRGRLNNNAQQRRNIKLVLSSVQRRLRLEIEIFL